MTEYFKIYCGRHKKKVKQIEYVYSPFTRAELRSWHKDTGFGPWGVKFNRKVMKLK